MQQQHGRPLADHVDVEDQRTDRDLHAPDTRVSGMTTPDYLDAVNDFVQAHRQELLDDLGEWLRIPSISASPAHEPDVRRSADWLVARLRSVGFPTVEVWETAGLPAVFAEWPSDDADAPTVLVYGHHDVQPVTPLELWEHPPFEPTVVGERLHARGAADDKGQVWFHTLGVTA